MKPTSIIFLIISVVLIVTGLVTTSIARGIAASEGIILSQSEDDNYAETREYSGVSKITVDLHDAKINIIGGSDKGYVELINFPMGMYEFSNTNRTLTVKNTMDGLSLSGLASMAAGFRGLGGIVNYMNLANSNKVINVYLAKENPVSIIECKLNEGSVNIENCDIYADYNITIDNGDLKASNLQTNSLVTAVVKNGNITVNNGNIKKLSATLEEGNLTLEGNIDSIKAEVETGDVTYNCYTSIGLINYKLTSNVGNIFVDGTDFGGYADKFYENISTLTDISVGAGNISLNSVKEPVD